MLYGMDDNEFSKLIKQEKLNKKKVLLVIGIIIACILIIYASFTVSYNLMNKKSTSENQTLSSEEKVQNDVNNQGTVIVPQTEKTDKQEKKQKQENTTDVYQGTHAQIAVHDIEKIKAKFVPQPNPDAQNIIKEIYKSEEKQVYLTFDDGPSKTITPQVLDILKQFDVKATFFVLGARVDLYPDILRRVYDEGHYVANHGYSHKYSQIYTNRDTTFEDFVKCENAIRNALGNQDYNSYLFRFPGGSSGGKYENVKAEARNLFNTYGVAYTNWNCLTGDAAGSNTKEECIQEMLETKANQNSIILLMHDSGDKQQTVDSLSDIIQFYKNEGYTFKTFYEIFK